MSADPAIKAFAELLARTEEPAARNALIKRAQLQAQNLAAPEAFEAPIRNLGEYLDTPVPVPPTLVEPRLVIRGGLVATIGRAGKGKTVMNLNRILRWAAGQPMFISAADPEGNPVYAPHDGKPLRTLIVENEGAGGLFHQQLGVMSTAESFVTPEERDLMRENVLIWGDGGYSGMRLDDAAKVDMLRAGVEKWHPDILFIEPFRGLWAGEENSSTDMAAVIDVLFQIMAEYDVGVLLSHHERKAGVGEDGEKMSAGRGSTVLEGAAVTMENFEGVKGGDYRELSVSKHRYRDDYTPPPLRMEWTGTKKWYSHVSEAVMDRSIIEALNQNDEEPMNKRTLADATGEKPGKLTEPLERMVKDERIIRLPSQSGPDGSTGYRYRLRTSDPDNDPLEI